MRGDIVPPNRDTQQPDTTRPASGFERPPSVAPDPRLTSARKVIPDEIVNATPQPLSDEPNVAPKKRRTSRKKLVLIIVTLVVAFLALCAVAVMVWYSQQLSAVEPQNQEKIKITVAPGTGPSGIAQTLKENGLIRDETAFGWYVRLAGKSGQLQSGAYRLSKSEDVPAIVKHLTSGNTDTFSITFLPGATLMKHRQVLIDAGYDAGQVDAALAKSYDDHPIFDGKPSDADLEGYIYGETYNFGADATPEQIIDRTLDQFESVVKENDLINSYKSQGFTLYQGITMASIIQREVATPEDAAQVAQVFKLRYDMGMQLGSDVTYQYIADKTGQARSVDLDSPYNTRRYTGLPPGPISSPGLAALKAVADPAPGDYVYFLSGDDDKTYFARTNEEHERNIRDHCEKKCQII